MKNQGSHPNACSLPPTFKTNIFLTGLNTEYLREIGKVIVFS